MNGNTSRSSSSSWFEFLLDTSLLQQHLTRENTEPTPTELIIQFLANAVPQVPREINVPPMIANFGENKKMEVDIALDGKPNGVENRKTHALKLLAVSIAAFLKWDLDVLEKQLPLPMQNTLLLDFIKIAFDKDDVTEVKQQLALNLNVLPDQALFALHVYNRWIIRALLLESFPTKMPKIVNVQLPGQQIPSFVPQAAMEAIVKLLHETWQDSLLILEKLSTLNRSIMIPTLRTFEIPTELKQDVQHHWDSGILISSEELQCQLLYDLGCLHFFHEDYTKAGDAFLKVNEHLTKLGTSPPYCRISKSHFQGYLKACCSILKRTDHNKCLTLQEKMYHIIQNKYHGLVALLLEDNHKQEIPIAYRAFLEQNIQYESFNEPELQKLHKQVATCNIVREVLSGNTVISNLMPQLSATNNCDVDMLIDAVQAAVSFANVQQKESLKHMLGFLLEHGNKQIAQLTTSNSDIAALFTANELLQFGSSKKAEPVISHIPNRDYSDNMVLQIGELERTLLLSYNPIEIQQMIKKIYTFNVRKPLWKLNMTWELPNPVEKFVLSLKPGFVQDFSYIMIAKARELARFKNFTEARNFFEIVELEVEMYKKLHRSIRWESLLVNLLQLQVNPVKLDVPNPELLSKCKACVSALLQDKEFLPRPEVIEHCAAYLLSIHQWEYLRSNSNSCSSRLEFGTILAAACIEIQNNNGSRKAVKELWETVLPIYSGNNAQQKRSSSGHLSSIIQRELPHALFSRHSLVQFISKIQDATVLSVMISCLAKLHNVLKDDINNSIYLEYPAPWPIVVSNAGAFSMKAVCESLVAILNHAVKLFSRHIPFLKTTAELNYILGYHAKCLKYYLEAGIITSNYFSQPIPRSTFGDSEYKKMIRCCSQLACHTQAAVLCQTMEEVDYMTAFKCLQEKNCSDAMDSYYDCFWDITILEFLVHLHAKRGEIEKKQLVLKIMGQLELNSNNNEEIRREAANARIAKFMRSMVEQYLNARKKMSRGNTSNDPVDKTPRVTPRYKGWTYT